MDRTAHPHRGVLDAFDAFIDAEIAFLGGAIAHPRSAWQYAVALLVARTLQLQQTILDAASAGYFEELYPLGRALLSTVVALVYIGHGTDHAAHEQRALMYLVHGRRSRRKMLDYLVRSRWMTATAAKQIEAESAMEEGRVLADARAAGFEPARDGKDKRYWTGYDDAALFRKMKALRWYHHFYAPWSDESHAQASALTPFSDDLMANGFQIGPRNHDPWFLLLASMEFGTECLRQVNKLYRLGRKTEVVDLFKHSVATLNAARQTGVPADLDRQT